MVHGDFDLLVLILGPFTGDALFTQRHKATYLLSDFILEKRLVGI